MINISYNLMPQKSLKDSILVMNSFFFATLCDSETDDVKIERILKRKKFSNSINFMIMPVCQGNHWTLVILANLNGSLREMECNFKFEQGEPFILYLDSFTQIHAEPQYSCLNKAIRVALSFIDPSKQIHPNKQYNVYSSRLNIPK